jgi:hypothetical protein
MPADKLLHGAQHRQTSDVSEVPPGSSLAVSWLTRPYAFFDRPDDEAPGDPVSHAE